MDRGAIYGNWRALVVDNKDKEKFGRVLVWIPDVMPEVNRKEGIWARPANNPLGGRNMEADSDNHFAGTSYIPQKGSWVFVFFEGGNINLPYYFGALDLENTTVLPENQLGSNYEKKWTILKSHEGRAVVVSDDPDDARTEITGKKRQIKTPPTGDTDSVYTIDGNQTTILFDERSGMEKILIRTYQGDFLHIDIDERSLQAYFEEDIRLECGGDFYLTVNGDIDVKSNAGDVALEVAAGQLDVNVSADCKITSGGSSNIKAQNYANLSAGGAINRRAGANINDDGVTLNQQTGVAGPATAAGTAQDANPQGERDT